MKIGEFAKACGTKISVLRHYDREGLLKPVYIDRFTEYRYYDRSQIPIYKNISEMKAVGFSLSEIRRILYSGESVEDIFEARKAELERQLHDLKLLKTRISGGIKMYADYRPFIEEFDTTFVNDKKAIGKWMVLGEYDNNGNCPAASLGDRHKHLYFLPNGEFYWCFGWSKGKLFYEDGVNKFANNYRLEQRGDDLYMVVDFKTPEYPETGETTAIALRKLDDVHYTRDMISRKDDINKPFINDPRVIGKWRSFCYFEHSELDKRDFIPWENPPKGDKNYLHEPYFKEIEFTENGHCSAVYSDEVISGDDKHTWTRGYWLRKWNSTACAYEIKEFDGKDYLIIEWKSGDYRFGDMESSYYVMERV